MLFTKIPIDCLNYNFVYRLKVGLIEWLFDNWMCEINPQNSDIDDLPFDSDKSLFTILLIYHINYYIVEMLKNYLIVDLYINWM